VSGRVSAIDIGSNAIRMMIVETPNASTRRLQVLKKFRAAVRLGHDVFTQGLITPASLETAKSTFHHYAKLNREWQVQTCRAVATSACREARNQRAFVEEIFKSSGIKIEVIDGVQEGQFIHLAVRKELDLQGQKSMLIDIGGGSVEVTFSQGDSIVTTKSFPMGTVRILENLKKRKLEESHLKIIMGEFLADLGQHIYTNCDNEPPHFAIGTGGNLECLGQLKVQILERNPRSFLTLEELNLIIEKLSPLKVKERIEKWGLRPDRADVILPAALLVQTIMRQAETEKILIPQVGLRDGIIWSLSKEP
ncbi:MAG: hypothetical protein AAGB31_01790, partial [Bdellovibrio sp.]